MKPRNTLFFITLYLTTCTIQLNAQRRVSFYEVPWRFPIWTAPPKDRLSVSDTSSTTRMIDQEERFTVVDSLSNPNFVFIRLFAFKNWGKNSDFSQFKQFQKEIEDRGLTLTTRTKGDLRTEFNRQTVAGSKYNNAFDAFFKDFKDEFIWPAEKNKDADLDSLYFIHNLENSAAQYFIRKSDFYICNKVLSRYEFTIGIATMPDKLRFGHYGTNGKGDKYFNFTSDVNLGMLIGEKFTPQRYHEQAFAFSVVGGFNISAIPLDATTSNGFLTQNTNVASFTPTVGFVLDIPQTGKNNNLQVGVFSGIDLLAGQVNRMWEYRNIPWLSVGVGYTLFTKPTDGTAITTANKKQ